MTPPMTITWSTLLLCAALAGCGKKSSDDDKDGGKQDAPPPGEAETPSDDSTDTPAGGSSTPGPDSPAAPDLSATTPVLIVFGGFTSCGTDANNAPDAIQQMMTPLFTALHEDLTAKSAQTPLYVLGCFATDPAKVTYTTSASTTASKTATLTALLADVQGLLKTTPKPSLYIVGHSYGGWTAMDLLLRLDATIPVGGFATLDPISRVTCTPQTFLAAALGGTPAQGCLEAPTDFGAAKLATLAQRATTWQNYYQTASTLLHSTAINGAANHALAYTGTGFEPHNDVASDEQIIAALKAVFVTGP